MCRGQCAVDACLQAPPIDCGSPRRTSGSPRRSNEEEQPCRRGRLRAPTAPALCALRARHGRGASLAARLHLGHARHSQGRLDSGVGRGPSTPCARQRARDPARRRCERKKCCAHQRICIASRPFASVHESARRNDGRRPTDGFYPDGRFRLRAAGVPGRGRGDRRGTATGAGARNPLALAPRLRPTQVRLYPKRAASPPRRGRRPTPSPRASPRRATPA